MRHFAIQQLIEEGYKADFPIFLPLADMADIVIGSISDQPTNLLFWLAACYGAFIIPFRGSALRKR